MIELYTWSTPNGLKASIMLEEVGLPYRVHPIDIGKDHQFHSDFLAISPNNKIPAIIDTDNGLRLMESGAILLYLAEKTGKLWPHPDQMARGRMADVADGWAGPVPRASSPLREVQSGKERLRRGALYQGSKTAVERAQGGSPSTNTWRTTIPLRISPSGLGFPDSSGKPSRLTTIRMSNAGTWRSRRGRRCKGDGMCRPAIAAFLCLDRRLGCGWTRGSYGRMPPTKPAR